MLAKLLKLNDPPNFYVYIKLDRPDTLDLSQGLPCQTAFYLDDDHAKPSWERRKLYITFGPCVPRCTSGWRCWLRVGADRPSIRSINRIGSGLPASSRRPSATCCGSW